MKVSDVIDRARIMLNDTDAAGYRWSDNELISYVNDAELTIAVVRQDSSPGVAVATLAAGIKQTVPADALRLFDVPRNIAADGTTPGRAIRITDRELLDMFEPNWPKSAKKNEIRHFLYDETIPYEFLVYPPANAGVKVEVRYSKRPVQHTAKNEDLVLNDSFFEAVLNYVMYRSYLKDAEFSGNAALAAQYLATTGSLLGVKLSKDIAYSPRVRRDGGNPEASVQIGGVA